MKIFTKNLLSFALVLMVFTIALRFGISAMLNMQMFTSVWLVVIMYSFVIFFAGWYFGKKDKEFLPIYDIGFRFHITTYIICNLIAELWFNLGLNSRYENIKSVHLTVLFWGLGLFLHFILLLLMRKYMIKGIKKSEIFE